MKLHKASVFRRPFLYLFFLIRVRYSGILRGSNAAPAETGHSSGVESEILVVRVDDVVVVKFIHHIKQTVLTCNG